MAAPQGRFRRRPHLSGNNDLPPSASFPSQRFALGVDLDRGRSFLCESFRIPVAPPGHASEIDRTSVHSSPPSGASSDFSGEHFQSNDPQALGHIVGQWSVFLVLFSVSYLVAVLILPKPAMAAFFLDVTAHLVFFETAHGFVRVNLVDAVLLRVPVIGRLRARQIEHHRRRDDRPLICYGFTVPPPVWDSLFGTLNWPLLPTEEASAGDFDRP